MALQAVHAAALRAYNAHSVGGDRDASGARLLEGQDLVAACQRGDRGAFEILFDRHKDRVFSLAIHFCGDEETAGDIAQDVFVKVLTRIGQFRGESDFATWLYRIVCNTTRDYHRRRKVAVSLDDVDSSPRLVEPATQERDVERRQLSVEIRRALLSLRPRMRLPLLLRYVGGLSYEQIGEILGLSAGTVASRLNRGHKELARRLQRWRGLV